MAGTVNLAVKAAGKAAEVFSHESYTQAATSKVFDSDFIGARTVRVYTNDAVVLNDYDRTGAGDRYGTPSNLTDTVQELQMTRDKSFTYIIDKGDATDVPAAVKNANSTVREQILRVAAPQRDTDILRSWVKDAGTAATEPSALTKTSTAEAILTGGEALDNNRVPRTDRFLFVKPSIYKLLKLDSDFIKRGDLAQQMLVKGNIGEFDGMSVISVPSSLWPAGVNFIIAQKDSSIAPCKINDYKVHINPPGVSGVKVEFRMYYDCFVLSTRRHGIYVSCESNVACAPVAFTPANGSKYAPGTTTIALASTSGSAIRYTLDGTDPKISASALNYSAAIPTTGWTAPAVTVRAYANKAGLYDSGVGEAGYVK